MSVARNLADFAHAADDMTGRNRLVNPDGAIYQRTVEATADDAYFADRWYILSQTGTVTPSALSDPEDGYPDGVRITQSQATAQRFGYAQIIEGKFCKDLRGKSGVFVPRVRISSSQAIRYAILGWTGTEDSVTSDVVNDWTSSDYTASNFFLGSNLSVIAVGAQTPSANTWTSLDAITDSLGSTFNNIIVAVWTEGTAAQNVTLDFDFNQFEEGDVGTPFERRHPGIEQALCYRYFWRLADGATHNGLWVATGSSTGHALQNLPMPMRAAPSVTFSGDHVFRHGNNTESIAAGDMSSQGPTTRTVRYQTTVLTLSGLAAGDAGLFRGDGASSIIDHDAEL